MRKPLLILLAAAVMAAPVFAADEGLAAKRSRYLDEVRVGSSFPATYRSVHIPPIEVEFRKGWPNDANKFQSPSRQFRPEDIKRVSQEMAQSLRASLQDDLQRAGYQIAPAPGPGVLVLKIAIEDVQVNAPDNSAPGTNTFMREAGEASLRIDGYDAGSNAKVMVINDHGKARPYMGGVERANTASNRFWFGEMFDRWADAVTKEIAGLGKAG
ncbi:MAG TPA: DUF3313 family protein [Usitatibacter sp.]|nr:DUF3313 family protein [Usitatibacter sp.]